MKISRRGIFATGLLIASITIGCGQSEDLGRVVGVVKIDGRPYSGGKVIFNPIAPEGSNVAGRSGTGRLDAEGRYELSTFVAGDGALVGPHSVTLFRAGSDIESRTDLEALDFQRFNMRGGNVTVEPGENEFNFEITSEELKRYGSRL